jgi:hypothetical protein
VTGPAGVHVHASRASALEAHTCTCTQAGHAELLCRSGSGWEMHLGDALSVMAAMPDQSVDCVVTSPPYWAKRDYGVTGQYGHDPDPAGYVATLVALTRARSDLSGLFMTALGRTMRLRCLRPSRLSLLRPEGWFPVVALRIAADGRTARYMPNASGPQLRMVRFMLLVKLAFGICVAGDAGYYLVASSSAISPWTLIILGLGIMIIGAATGLLVWSWRPVLVITGDSLRLWPARRSAEGKRGPLWIPVSDVTGVGLVFRRLGQTGDSGSGWYLMIWHGDERGEPVAICYAPVLRSGHDVRGPQKLLAAAPASPPGGIRPPFNLQTFDPAADTDPAKLATTHAGRVAREVYEYVLAKQGSAGLLAITRQQTHVPAKALGTADVEAYWSPDGVIGPVDRR